MIKVVIPVKNAHHAMEYFNQVMADGLKNGVDFRWWFIPKETDDWSTVKGAAIELEFTDPVLATFYELKWAK